MDEASETALGRLQRAFSFPKKDLPLMGLAWIILKGNLPPAKILASMPLSVPMKRASFPFSLSTNASAIAIPGKRGPPVPPPATTHLITDPHGSKGGAESPPRHK